MTMLPKKAKQSVTKDGERIAPRIEGILIRQQVTQQDHRGSLTEIYSRSGDTMTSRWCSSTPSPHVQE